MGAIGKAIGAGTQILSMIGQRQREERSLNNQKDLMDIQFRNQKSLNLQGHDLQMQAWEKTNYPAQMKMMEEAGLNPGLMYQMGGAGGTTGGQGGGSAASGHAPQPQSMELGNMLAAAKMKSEIELLQAQKDKLNTETDVIGTTGIEEAKTRIQKMIAETQNEELKIKLTEIQTDIEEINRANKQYQINAEIDNTIENTNKLKLENAITTEAYDDIIEEIKQNAIGRSIENNLNKAKISLTDAQKKQVTASIVQKWTELGISQEGVKNQANTVEIAKFRAELEREYPSLWQMGGSIVKEAWDTLTNIERKIRGFSPKKKEIELKYK